MTYAMHPRLRLPDRVFCVLYFTVLLTISYCSKLQCYIGRIGTKERRALELVNCTTPPTMRPVTACLIYRYQSNGNGSQGDTSRLLFSEVGTEDFACDEKHVCNMDKTTLKTWVMNTTYKGLKGDMYCCSASGCNDPRPFSKPQTHLECFSGKSLLNDVKGEFRPCKSNYCFNITVDNSTKFGCDKESNCMRKGISDGCSNIKDGKYDQRLCCCEKSECNFQKKKVFHLTSRESGIPESTIPVKPTVSRDPPTLPDTHRQQQLQKSRVAGIVSAVVLGLALVILLTVIAIKQWQKYREKYNFSYMQLTADMMTL